MHEAQLHEENSFITLTYNNENLPQDNSLDVHHWQHFAKRLRHRVGKFRFFHAGEYGEANRRPHYHAAIFGLDFHQDRQVCKKSKGNKLYTSPRLTDIWGKGDVWIGNLTPDSAAYIAKYITKKITGDDALEHYLHVNEETGEITELKPEYATQSRNPGIGNAWFEKYHDDLYPDDFAIFKEQRAKVPRYYDRKLKETRPELHKKILDARMQRSRDNPDNTRERRETIEKVTEARLKMKTTTL